MLPAGGQGALAIQIRKADSEIAQLLTKINHQQTQIAVKCERAFLRELGGSCSTPVAIHAEVENDALKLKTIIFSYDGSEIFETNSSGKINIEDAIALGVKAAQKTKVEAADLLQKILK